MSGKSMLLKPTQIFRLLFRQSRFRVRSMCDLPKLQLVLLIFRMGQVGLLCKAQFQQPYMGPQFSQSQPFNPVDNPIQNRIPFSTYPNQNQYADTLHPQQWPGQGPLQQTQFHTPNVGVGAPVPGGSPRQFNHFPGQQISQLPMGQAYQPPQMPPFQGSPVAGSYQNPVGMGIGPSYPLEPPPRQMSQPSLSNYNNVQFPNSLPVINGQGYQQQFNQPAPNFVQPLPYQPALERESVPPPFQDNTPKREPIKIGSERSKTGISLQILDDVARQRANSKAHQAKSVPQKTEGSDSSSSHAFVSRLIENATAAHHANPGHRSPVLRAPKHPHHPIRKTLPRHRGDTPFYSQAHLDAHHRRLMSHHETKEDENFEKDKAVLPWYLHRAEQLEKLHKEQSSQQVIKMPPKHLQMPPKQLQMHT